MRRLRSLPASARPRSLWATGVTASALLLIVVALALLVMGLASQETRITTYAVIGEVSSRRRN